MAGEGAVDADASGGNAAEERYASHRFKCHDPMVRLLHVVDVQPKLDALLIANGLPTKTADGLEAIRMWEEGERDEEEGEQPTIEIIFAPVGGDPDSPPQGRHRRSAEAGECLVVRRRGRRARMA